MKTALTSTGEICMVTVQDDSREDGLRHIDLGTYFLDASGRRCLVTTADLARQYSNMIDVPVYVQKVHPVVTGGVR